MEYELLLVDKIKSTFRRQVVQAEAKKNAVDLIKSFFQRLKESLSKELQYVKKDKLSINMDELNNIYSLNFNNDFLQIICEDDLINVKIIINGDSDTYYYYFNDELNKYTDQDLNEPFNEVKFSELIRLIAKKH